MTLIILVDLGFKFDEELGKFETFRRLTALKGAEILFYPTE